MGAYEDNAGNHPQMGGNGREWVPFVGKGTNYHTSPTHNSAQVVLSDAVMSRLIHAGRLAYDIEDAPGSVSSDVFEKTIEAFSPPGHLSWYNGLTSARKEKYRDNTAAQPDPLKDPIPS